MYFPVKITVFMSDNVVNCASEIDLKDHLLYL